MYYGVKVKDTLRVPPNRFDEDLSQVLAEIARESFEGKIDPDLGFIVAVTEINKIYQGKLISGDGGAYYETDFGLLCYLPEIDEIVSGEVVECVDFGAFIRIGTIDALCHVSQIADDYFRYIPKNALLRGDKSKLDLLINTKVRARVIAVSIGKTAIRVGLTMRQDALGAIDWIEEWKKGGPKDSTKVAEEAS
ncbi:MAG: DNA-directed RNA polymerase [Candidatus Heimdallarchaeota archaeon]|nr:DNA-directed RNA polymerase [Candidatus Heimdallarchaeota archaeon]